MVWEFDLPYRENARVFFLSVIASYLQFGEVEEESTRLLRKQAGARGSFGLDILLQPGMKPEPLIFRVTVLLAKQNGASCAREKPNWLSV